MAFIMNRILHTCHVKEKKHQFITIVFKNHIRNERTFAYTYPWLKQSVFQQNDRLTVKRCFSRIPKSWFRLKKKPYDIVEIHEVGPRRNVPDYIVKPDYAETGISIDQDTIHIFNESEVESMRQSCALAKIILEEVGKSVRPGISTDELDAIAHNLCIHYNAYPSPLNYRGFPKSICTSVNNIACHGIPDSRKLLEGDVISIDISVFYNGYHGDCAATFNVGKVNEEGQKLVDIASQCLSEAIAICRPGQFFCQIGKTISAFASHHGFSVIPAFCGHGIGTSFHTPPNILHYDNEELGVMEKGMIFTIEPVICEGRPDIVILEDGWTAATEDDSRSAQFEHTLLINSDGAEILTVSTAFKNTVK